MRVVLNVIGHSSQFFPGKTTRLEVDLHEPASIRQILTSLGVKPELIMHVSSAGETHTKDYVPRDGEEVTLVSPPSGG